MPTCTLPFEILLEIFNDTTESSTLQLTRGDDSLASNATVLLHPQEGISLVLNAGSSYQYLLKQQRRKAQISVKVWKDTRISTTDIFVKKRAPPSEYPAMASQGISIECHPISQG
ncbi:hypothetical protein BJ912DRAFT_950228 [Pholiota molesta]|nr:hypothetical protein BJ912DRAFT_950228 [Pholiota molesta]